MIQIIIEIKSCRDNYLDLEHPRNQVKWVKRFLKNIKEKNQKDNPYINTITHTEIIKTVSPVVVEAFEVFSIKYGLEKNISFILNNQEISYSNLPIIYNDLGDPYDEIDEVRAENLFNHRYGD